MKSGSTGLGKMTLEMRMANKDSMDKLPPTSPPEGALVVYAKTHDPVIWNLWIGFEAEDMPDLLKTALRPSVLWFVFKSLVKTPFAGRKEKKEVLQAVPAKAA